MKNSKIIGRKRIARMGAYSLVVSLVLLCVLIVANLFINALPEHLTRFDTTGKGITKISEESERFVASLDEDVAIYWLCEGGEVDDTLSLLLARYTAASEHVKLEVIDPIADPTFLNKYSVSDLNNGSFIVESARRYQVIDLAEMTYYINDFIGTDYQLTYDELSYYQQYYSAYLQYSTTTSHFRGEALLTSAIDFVTLETIPHAYVLKGHGDTALPEGILDLFDAINVEIEEINLQTADTVPEDANCLILFDPNTDISDHEKILIDAYLAAGGSFMLATDPETVGCENIMALGASFGMSAEEGMVIDPSENMYQDDVTHQLLPNVSNTHTVTYFVGNNGYKPYMPESHALSLASETDMPEGVTALESLFWTSEEGNRISIDGNKTLLQEEASEQVVAAAATRDITLADGTTDTSYFTWFASTEAFTDDAAEVTSDGNYYYFATAVSWMSESYNSAYSTIAAVDMSGSLTDITMTDVVIWGIVLVVIIPVGLLVTGIVIWARRRAR